MAVVILLRGVNVGGHRTLRPAELARALGEYGVVNVGAAGTLVALEPGSRSRMRAAILRQLTFAPEITFCDSRELARLVAAGPFGADDSSPDRVRFVSFFPAAVRAVPPLPLTIPDRAPWFVRVIAVHGRLAVGEYRRHMRTIGYLGQLDDLFGAHATTRSWSTIEAILRVTNRQG